MNWVVNGKPEWMLYEFPVFLCLCRCLRACKLKIQCCTLWCASKNFSLIIISTPFSPWFLPVEPISFFSRLSEAGKPIQIQIQILRDQNWRTEPILVASRTQNISQNLLKYLATYLTFWISFSRNYQSFL